MSNFTARTRLRGETEYHKATWLDSFYGPRRYGIKFLEGKHRGEVFQEQECTIAKDDKYLLGGRNDDTN